MKTQQNLLLFLGWVSFFTTISGASGCSGGPSIRKVSLFQKELLFQKTFKNVDQNTTTASAPSPPPGSAHLGHASDRRRCGSHADRRWSVGSLAWLGGLYLAAFGFLGERKRSARVFGGLECFGCFWYRSMAEGDRRKCCPGWISGISGSSCWSDF